MENATPSGEKIFLSAENTKDGYAPAGMSAPADGVKYVTRFGARKKARKMARG